MTAAPCPQFQLHPPPHDRPSKHFSLLEASPLQHRSCCCCHCQLPNVALTKTRPRFVPGAQSAPSNPEHLCLKMKKEQTRNRRVKSRIKKYQVIASMNRKKHTHTHSITFFSTHAPTQQSNLSAPPATTIPNCFFQGHCLLVLFLCVCLCVCSWPHSV